MKHFIIYKLYSDDRYIISGPHAEFEYIYKAMEIINYDGAHSLDILNESAMDIFNVYMECESKFNIISESNYNTEQTINLIETLKIIDENGGIEVSTIFDPYDCPF